MLKRLYGKVLQGRFAALLWPTRSPNHPSRLDSPYNRANTFFESAPNGSLSEQLQTLFRLHDQRVSHSMGGIV